MRILFSLILILACLCALGSSAIDSTESKLTTKLTPINSPSYEDHAKDLTPSASDRTFHISKEYGQPVGYGGGGPYGSYLGLGTSIYGPGTAYRGTGLNPGYLNPSYKGYPVGGPSGIIGGGHVGYGYYGTAGYNPGYGGYGGYGGYAGNSGYNGYAVGLDGYGGYGSGYGYGGYGSGIYDDGYGGYYGYDGRSGYGRYGGLDKYGTGYSGYGSTNYGSTYNARSNYDPYVNRNTNYGSYTGYPSGYRGYS
ncbi:unnamed protein product [Xylocopa violacea]|uniref:Prisilkin-39 n=1 Tax=Xylocopa violacea TaxID=135666 RepID=A0ABP1PG06_XYLVO